ncbi:PTS sugar transporter subunit IIA [Geosporobacter ferrireducens]|uniref:PTS EIIA type-2 domain-containing protein n=1 Tax=Geosporobacter ferrireducens TaxID=1424294 RepID=A0A1D8GP11_9FIRM|nr:PTS sugar transporter subunit IIA [Geosporobacter ferrireducens]AOT72632.1 hypothetical protein Gferi_25600 [Geosporobacter ferrireducens]MTI55034.1 PTS sugar transporter subunit IIA [Geosporobacter ferrireducens]
MAKFSFDKRTVKARLQAGSDKEVLRQMATLLYQAGYVEDSFIDAIIQREDIFPTGLPIESYGVAIPHTDPHHVNKPMIAVATLEKPVNFSVMGNPEEKTEVGIVFMLAMKNSSSQLQLLSNLMNVIQDTMLLKKIYKTRNEKELLEILNHVVTF